MNTLTKKDIFEAKLKGHSIRVHEAFIPFDLLVETGIWEQRETAFKGVSYVAKYATVIYKNVSDSGQTQIKDLMIPGDIYTL